MGSVLKIVVGALIVGSFGFIAYIGREEYGIAREEGRAPARAVLRAIRVTFDSFVMGH